MCYLLRRSVHTEFYIFHAKGLFMSKVKSWCRANAMLVISLLAAVVTAFFVPPDRDYLGYYDLKTLACLFCVLAVVGALRDLHIFSALSQRMVHTFSTVRGVCTALVVITMFGSMLLTNDTALLTFLPLGWFVLSSTGQEKHTALLFILQNCAANLCGMITPFGNPQNLYLYTISGLSLWDFIRIMLPYSFVSAILLLIFILFLPKDTVSTATAANSTTTVTASNTSNVICEAVKARKNSRILFAFYLILFLLCLLTVLHILPYQIMFLLVLTGFLLLDYRVLKDVDYFLLLTFLCFFIFIGNMKQISLVHELISKLLVHHEVLMGIGASQIISNVPAAILLSGFTDDYSALLIGVNLGGLGTLIASLASLISFKFYTHSNGSDTRRFLGIFTLYNVIFLGVLFVLSLILC